MQTPGIGSTATCRLRSAGAFLFLSVVVLSLVLAPPVGQVARALPIAIGLIPTETGVGDLSFNWMAYQGLLRAETELGVVGTVYTPADPDDYAAQIQQCVDDGNALCITVGFPMADATLAAALANPATHFALVDSSWDSYPDNLRGIVFAVESAAYMAGTLAALMAGGGAVGIVSGIAVPPVIDLTEPFLYGAQCARAGTEVLIDYTGDFGDPDLGVEVAQRQMDQGAGVIFGCGGLTGNGAILHAAQSGAWAVGVDTDQWISLFESGAVAGSERLLTSVMKRIDNAVYDTIADEVAGAFTPGTATYDLAGGGVDLAPYHEAEGSIPQAAKDAVEAVRQDILDGTVDVWQPCAGGSVPAWHQSNADGFGDPANQQVPSLEVFGDHLYAGTWNSEAEAIGFEIWRTADGRAWEQVASELGNGAADLAVFDGSLYAGTWDGAVWRSANGLAWEQVVGDGFGDPNNGIARFTVYGGMLYVTTWSNTGTEVWRTGDGTAWEQFGDDGLGDPNNIGAIASAVYGNRLYLGIGNWATGAQIWRTDGESWEQIAGEGFGDAANGAVSSLAEFHGQLYAGLWNEGGIQVWRWSENMPWQPVVGPGGFGDPATNETSALEVLNGLLYLVVQNEATGLEVWRTADGTDWEQVGFGGFGDASNGWSYWDNGTVAFRDGLFVATNNFSTGGEVWRMLPYAIRMPLVGRNYDPARIVLWHTWSDDYLAEYEEIIVEYNQAHPEGSIMAVRQDDMAAALEEAIPAESGPDIVAWANDRIGYGASAGYFAPLDPWIDVGYLEAHFEPAAVQAMLWSDQIWGLPDTQEGIALVYNKALVGTAQIPEPDDWTGLLAQAEAFRLAHPDLYYLCNQGLGNADAYHVGPIYFGHGLSQYGGYVDEEGNAYLDTPEALEAAEWISDLRPFAPAETSHEICKGMLIGGEAGIWWTGPWAIADLQNAGIDYGIAPMGSPFVGIRLLLLTSNALDRGHQEQAVDFMKHLTSAEAQVRLTLANRTIPTNTAALNDPEVQALYEIAQFGASLNLGTPMGNHIYTDCQWGPVGDATTAIWNGSQTPADAMAAAQVAIEDCVVGMPAPR